MGFAHSIATHNCHTVHHVYRNPLIGGNAHPTQSGGWRVADGVGWPGVSGQTTASALHKRTRTGELRAHTEHATRIYGIVGARQRGRNAGRCTSVLRFCAVYCAWCTARDRPLVRRKENAPLFFLSLVKPAADSWGEMTIQKSALGQ